MRNHEFSRKQRHQKVAIKRRMEHFLLGRWNEGDANEHRRMICPTMATTELTLSPGATRSSKNATCCSHWVHYCFSVHALFISEYFQEATKHSVLVPFCGLLLSVSVCRLPRSATSQSIWVLSCTVKWPGLAHDNGRGCEREIRRRQIFLIETIQLF